MLIGPLLLTIAATFPEFVPHPVAAGLKGGYQVVVTDMNRDGKPDLIGLAQGLTELSWYENPTWKRHIIAGGLNKMINLAAIDIDADGTPEIVVAHEFANQAKNSIGIVSLLQRRKDAPDAAWSVTEIDRIPTSHRLRVANLGPGMGRVVINAPLTGTKAEAPDYRDKAPLVYYAPGNWMRQIIARDDEGVVHGILVMDWNGDGRDDVLTASFQGIHVYSTTGAGQPWKRERIAAGSFEPWPKSGSSDVAVGKTRKGAWFIGAIEPWHGANVAVYREKKKGQWVRQVIDGTLVDGHTILAADFDGDGTDELVAGFRGTGRSVFAYWTNDKAEKWTKQVIDNGGMAAAACAAADLNGDGRVDLACIGQATANLVWYENRKVQ